MDKDITLLVTVQDANTILESLAAQPLGKSINTFLKVQQQAQQQAAQSQAVTPAQVAAEQAATNGKLSNWVMDPNRFYKLLVNPVLTLMGEAPGVGIPVDDPSRVIVMCIAGQESNWEYRKQQGGPARSYWQFEGAGGGSGEVFERCPDQLKATCDALDIPFDQPTIFEAMAWNGILQCVMARLLLYPDPAPLPPVGNKQAAWDYYLRNWRPGAPHPEAWSGHYDTSVAAMKAADSDTIAAGLMSVPETSRIEELVLELAGEIERVRK